MDRSSAALHSPGPTNRTNAIKASPCSTVESCNELPISTANHWALFATITSKSSVIAIGSTKPTAVRVASQFHASAANGQLIDSCHRTHLYAVEESANRAKQSQYVAASAPSSTGSALSPLDAGEVSMGAGSLVGAQGNSLADHFNAINLSRRTHIDTHRHLAATATQAKVSATVATIGRSVPITAGTERGRASIIDRAVAIIIDTIADFTLSTITLNTL